MVTGCISVGITYTTDKHLRDLSLYVKLLLSQRHADILTWRKFIGKYNWCRARQDDKVVHHKMVALLNDHIGRGEQVVELDDEATEMLKNMVKRCSMSFDF